MHLPVFCEDCQQADTFAQGGGDISFFVLSQARTPSIERANRSPLAHVLHIFYPPPLRTTLLVTQRPKSFHPAFMWIVDVIINFTYFNSPGHCCAVGRKAFLNEHVYPAMYFH